MSRRSGEQCMLTFLHATAWMISDILSIGGNHRFSFSSTVGGYTRGLCIEAYSTGFKKTRDFGPNGSTIPRILEERQAVYLVFLP